MSVGAISERKEQPAFVRFERVAKENKAETLKQGHYVAVDVDYALITPPYSKDEVRIKVSSWFTNMEADVRNGRMPKEWQETYHRQFSAWQNGQEMPPEGVPVRGWGVISPAQQATLIAMHILTVESLANINDEGMRRIGMGALELKNKAVAWLQQLKDKGPLVVEVAALKTENAHLKTSLETMQRQISELVANQPRAAEHVDVTESISADDILPEPEPKTLSLKKK